MPIIPSHLTMDTVESSTVPGSLQLMTRMHERATLNPTPMVFSMRWTLLGTGGRGKGPAIQASRQSRQVNTAGQEGLPREGRGSCAGTQQGCQTQA